MALAAGEYEDRNKHGWEREKYDGGGKKVFIRNPAHPGNLGGVKRHHGGGTLSERQRFVFFKSEQGAYTFHKPVTKQDYLFVCFLSLDRWILSCGMQVLAEHNDRFNYLLTLIDVLSEKVLRTSLKESLVKGYSSAGPSFKRQSDTSKVKNRRR